MKKITITVLILLALSAIGYFGYRIIQARRQSNTLSSLQTITATRGSLTATVGATGTVRAGPNRHHHLADHGELLTKYTYRLGR